VILVDTNVWSEMTKLRTDPVVEKWVIANSSQLRMSAIVLAEIRVGIENPTAAHKRAGLEIWYDQLESDYADTLLTFGANEARHFGRLIAAKKMQKQETKLLDIQIAAQALANDCAVATRNTQDFVWTGVKLINPWTE